jgi:uncharacterized membrane protein YfcA
MDHTYPLTAAAAFLGGAINSIAGGGTLLTFPSLLAVVSPVAANATSTLALLPGSFASGWGYREEIRASRRMLALLLPPSLVGGVLGTLAVTRFPERVFAELVPWLLLVASTLLVLQRPVARWLGAHAHGEPKGSTVAAIVFFQFLVGVYGGYFGAGIGILMLSSLAFMGIPNINQMNGIKSVLAAAMNGMSAIIFAADQRVVWRYALPMAAASIVGGYLAARAARRLPAQYVRGAVIAIGFAVAGYSFAAR